MYFRTAIGLMAVCLIFGCGRESSVVPDRAELLIYCGTTMIHPMREIADLIEAERGCVIKISKGASGHLLESIRFNQVGDLYLPGSESYMNTCREEGWVEETRFVGYNVAAIVVPSGNPLHLSNDPVALTNRDVLVILADPASGSIGREARAVLEWRGVSDAVFRNLPVWTADSKDITRAIREGTADVGINWYATTLWQENAAVVEGLLMEESIAPRKRLVLGLLRTSRFPDAARRFMEVAVSGEGRAIFEKYGFFQMGEADD